METSSHLKVTRLPTGRSHGANGSWIEMSMTASLRLKAWVAGTRLSVARKLGPLLLTLATARARRRLERSGPIEVLVDTSALASAVTHESRWVSSGPTKWGDVVVDAGYLARVPVRKRPSRGAPEHEVRDFHDACFLTGIAHLARLGLIRLRSSGELRMEQWGHPVGMLKGYSLFSRTVFEGVAITPLDEMPDMVMGPQWMNVPALKEQQAERLGRVEDELYKGLLARLGMKSSQDAWHIRTAEMHGMYCFLTTDYALVRNLIAQGKHKPICSLRTKVLSPAQLGAVLGLRPLNPRHVSHEGASFPVRSDLHMPGSKRRPRRRIP
jgi:hypothetical protein